MSPEESEPAERLTTGRNSDVDRRPLALLQKPQAFSDPTDVQHLRERCREKIGMSVVKPSPLAQDLW